VRTKLSCVRKFRIAVHKLMLNLKSLERFKNNSRRIIHF